MERMSFSEIKKHIIGINSYEAFLRDNRKLVNRYLNTVLWFCILTGPAIAAGIYFGVFAEATYFTCLAVSSCMLLLALIHQLLITKWPYSEFAGYYAIVSMELLLMFMVYKHIHIHITWFFIPLLSILFSEPIMFYFSLITNYLAMLISTWLIAPHNASINSDFNTPFEYFKNTMLGYTIETIIMLVGGLTITRILYDYFTVLLTKNKEVSDYAERLNEQMSILFSMTEIYDNVNLIDLKSMKEMSLSDQSYNYHDLDFEKHAHTVMNHKIKKHVSPEHLDAFLEFTNLRTLEKRLTGKRFIYGEFVNVDTGWFRAQYINAESYENGIPYLVVYTVQNINMDKNREEHLIRISLTDELTQLFNRRSLDNDLARYKDEPLEDDFVIASIDINRLKYTNDTFGHDAGDELIQAAAECISSALGTFGKVYRTGGDEFTAVIHSYNISEIDKKIKKAASSWKGNYNNSLALSIGYAAHRDYPGDTIDELKKKADSRMYDEKSKFYQETGLERRRR
ncbi:GGDEF domain-containing protein [Butyrivibrio sp. WCE2006]|uniref:GGDEF domain-containing protein n=1 Tax=Butyrivibrio sp. WCE2006 TaxID=1410611 RepID=UPI000679362C|nr:GGDEF domain-containing protein [Butyrivibrio sp. WCE2006]